VVHDLSQSHFHVKSESRTAHCGLRTYAIATHGICFVNPAEIARFIHARMDLSISHSVFVFGCFAFRIPYIVHNHESVFPSSSCSLADDRTPSCQWKNPTPAPAPSPTAFSTAGHANPMFLDASCLGLPRSQLDCGTLSAGPKPRRACHRVRPRYLPV
jgi:hypothetical protein